MHGSMKKADPGHERRTVSSAQMRGRDSGYVAVALLVGAYPGLTLGCRWASLQVAFSASLPRLHMPRNQQLETSPAVFGWGILWLGHPCKAHFLCRI